MSDKSLFAQAKFAWHRACARIPARMDRAGAWLFEWVFKALKPVIEPVESKMERLNKEREPKWLLARAAIKAGNVDALRELLDAPGKMDALKSGMGHGMLMCEAGREGSISCGEALIVSGYSLEDYDASGRDALGWAVKSGKNDFLAWALSRGAKVKLSYHGASGLVRHGGPLVEALEAGAHEAFKMLESHAKCTVTARVRLLRIGARQRAAGPILSALLSRAEWREALSEHDQRSGAPTLLIKACVNACTSGPEIIELLAAISEVGAARESSWVSGRRKINAAQAVMSCELLSEEELGSILNILHRFDPEGQLSVRHPQSVSSFQLACHRRGGVAMRWLLARGSDPAQEPGGVAATAEWAVKCTNPEALSCLVQRLSAEELQATLVATLGTRWSSNSCDMLMVLLSAGARPMGPEGSGSILISAAARSEVGFINMLLPGADWNRELESELKRVAKDAVDASAKGLVIDRWAERAEIGRASEGNVISLRGQRL